MKLFTRTLATIALASLGGGAVFSQNTPAPVAPDGVVFSEDAFFDRLGVNVHVNYNDGAYANLDKVVNDVNYIGFRHVRTHAGGGVVPVSSYVNMAGKGVQFTLIARSDKHPNVSVDFAEQLAAQAPGSIAAIEGFNEINNAPITFGGEKSEKAAKAAQAALYARVKASPQLSRLPVIYFTGGTMVSDVSGMADVVAVHPYNNNASQPGSWFSHHMREWFSGSAAQLPRMATEFGSFTLPDGWPDGKAWWGSGTDLGVDQTTQAKIVLNGFMEGMMRGFDRSYVYELLDQKPDPQMKEPQFHFGLFTSQHQPKEAAKALRNLTTFLRQNGSGGSSGTITGAVEEDSKLIGWLGIRQDDGSLVLAVWNREPLWKWDQNSSRPVESAMLPVTIRGSSNSATVQASVFDPLTASHTPLQAGADGGYSLSVPNYPLLVWIRR